MEIPKKLFACDLDDGRVLRLIGEVDRCPYALAHKDQNGQNDCRDNQEHRFNLWVIVPVRRALASVRPITGNEESKRALNQHKSNTANDQNCVKQTVDPRAMLGSQSRKPVRLCDKKIK